MLSAEELIEVREKARPELPVVGVKSFEPDGTPEELQLIQNKISEIELLICCNRVKMLGTLSQAVWRPELNLAEITHQTGPYWETMGHMVAQKLYIYPEEALYLLEIGALEISYNGILLSVQRAYLVFFNEKTDITIEKYRVYSYLNSHGYIVLRHSSDNILRKNEKKLQIHNNDLELENFDSQFKFEKKRKEGTDSNSGRIKKIKLQEDIIFPVIYNEEDDLQKVCNKMQIFKSLNYTSVESFNFDFDIYKQCSGKQAFKKSCQGLPHFRVIIQRSEDLMPDLSEISSLSNKLKDGVPIIQAIVFPDYIAFYEMESVIVPNAYD